MKSQSTSAGERQESQGEARLDTTLLSVLSDPSRQAIFNLILSEPKPVKVIASELPISQAAVSQHLKIMLDANLIRKRISGRYHFYSVNPIALEELSSQFGALRNAALRYPELPPDESINQTLKQWQNKWSEHDVNSFGNALRLVLIGNRLQQMVQEDAERFDLGIAHIRLLSILDRNPNKLHSFADISEVSLVPFSTTVRQIKELKSRGLIFTTSEIGDKNQYFTISDKGIKLINDFYKTVQESSHKSIRAMKSDESKIFSALLSKLLQSM